MRSFYFLIAAGFICIMAIATMVMINNAEQSPLFVAGKVVLEEGMDAGPATIVFITLFDDDSPMPYGAARYKLNSKPTGEVLDFVLTKENTQVMNPQASPPQNLRVKARLDWDGQAGPDQPGDIVGEVKGVGFGQRDVLVKLNTRIGSVE